jgi:hypothetical protein
MYKILARFMTMEAKYPEECKKAREESWQKLVSCFSRTPATVFLSGT